MAEAFTEDQKRGLAGRARSINDRLAAPESLIFEGDDSSGGETLLARWKNSFVDNSSFESHLDAIGASRRDCLAVLNADRLADSRPIPGWVDAISAMATHIESLDPPTKQSVSGERWAFGELVRGISEYLRTRLPEIVHRNLSEEAIDDAVHWFFQRFEHRFSRLLIAEFESFVDESENGNTAHSADSPTTVQYDRFVDRLFSGGFTRLCLEYPVFARLLAHQVEDWIAVLEEFSRRLDQDASLLTESFGLSKPPGSVVAIDPRSIDSTSMRRTALRFTFESGRSVVYEPRCVAADRRFYRLLERLDEHTEFGFDPPTILDRDAYGWVEADKRSECETRSGLDRYYRRAGALMCLAYLLEMRGCEFENVRAMGDQPVFAGVQTICHPQLKLEEKTAVSTLRDRSVLLTTPVLPRSPESEAEDPSGGSMSLAGFPLAEDERDHGTVPRIKARNTDAMTVEFGSREATTGPHLPAFEGEVFPPDEFVEEIVDGFETVYRTVLELRDADRLEEELMLPDAFDGIETRYLPRPRHRYVQVMNELLSPEHLADGARFDIELNSRLGPPCSDGSGDLAGAVVAIERRSLRRLEVPRLTARTDETTVGGRDSTPRLRTERSGLDRCRARIKSMSRVDMEMQLEIVRGVYEGIPAPAMAQDPDGTRATVTDEALLDEARTIFERIIEIAVEVPDGYDWVSTTRLPYRGKPRVAFVPTDDSLYMGRLGIAVFIAALYDRTGCDRHRDIARTIVGPMVRTLRDTPTAATNQGLGGASGLGSTAYGLAVTGELLEDPTLLEAANEAAALVTESVIAQDRTFDVVNGSAGTVLGLLGVHDRAPDSALVSTVVECGEHLLDHRVAADGGCAWPTMGSATPTGFSHGAGGIAYALLRLWDVTGDDRFRDAGLDAMAYEDAQYVPDAGNWATNRSSQGGDSFADKWCWGRTGIGLARLGAADYCDADRVVKGYERALETFPTAEMGPHDHLCCGDAGRATFLLEAERRLDRRPGEARELLGGVLERNAGRDAYRTNAMAAQLPTPSLFQGISGIGYAALRVSAPERLPCLLLWE